MRVYFPYFGSEGGDKVDAHLRLSSVRSQKEVGGSIRNGHCARGRMHARTSNGSVSAWTADKWQACAYYSFEYSPESSVVPSTVTMTASSGTAGLPFPLNTAAL